MSKTTPDTRPSTIEQDAVHTIAPAVDVFEDASGITLLADMPGVPREMKRMFAEQVIPRVEALRPEPTVFQVRLYRSFGLSESGADQALAGLEDRHPGVKLGFRAHFPEIQIKLTVKGPDVAAAEARLAAAATEVTATIGANIFSDGDPMEAVIGAMFYVMAHVDGRIFWDPSLPDMVAAQRGACYDEIMRVLAALPEARLVEPTHRMLPIRLQGWGRMSASGSGFSSDTAWRESIRWVRMRRASRAMSSVRVMVWGEYCA